MNSHLSIRLVVLDRVKSNGYSSNLFYQSVERLLTNEIVEINYNLKREFDLYGSILNKVYITNNKRKLETEILAICNQYTSTKNSKSADKIISIYFYGLLNDRISTGYNERISERLIPKEIILDILQNSKHQYSKTLRLVLMGDKNSVPGITSEYDAVDVLSLCIASESSEDKYDLSSAFKKISFDEEMIKNGKLSYDSILTSALIISAAFKNGLYFPEFRKEVKLYSGENSVVNEKYRNALREFYWFKLFGLRIPIYLIPILIFGGEWFVFKSGLIAEVGLGMLTIGESSFPKLEEITMYFVNPTLFSFLAYIHIKVIIKSINNE